METPQVKLGDASMAAPFTSRIPSGALRRRHHQTRTMHPRQRHPDAAGARALLSHQRVLPLRALPRRHPIFGQPDDRQRVGADGRVAGVFVRDAGAHAVERQTAALHLPPGQLFVADWSTGDSHRMHGVRRAHGQGGDRGGSGFPGEHPGGGGARGGAQANATEEQRSIWAQGPPFNPSLLNTVVFLVETVQRVCVMLVNYKGRPFMMGAVENVPSSCPSRPWWWAPSCARLRSPWLNKWLQLVPMPDDDFRFKILGVLAVTVLGTIAWDQIMLFLFAPHVLFTAYRDTLHALPRPRISPNPPKSHLRARRGVPVLPPPGDQG